MADHSTPTQLEGDLEESRGNERAEEGIEREEYPFFPLRTLDGMEENDGLRGIRAIGHEG
jgi:hypothetical protein